MEGGDGKIAALMRQRRVTACLKNEADEGAQTAVLEAEMDAKLNMWINSTQDAERPKGPVECAPSEVEVAAATARKKKPKPPTSGVFENMPQASNVDVKWSDRRTTVRAKAPGGAIGLPGIEALNQSMESKPLASKAHAGASWKERRITSALKVPQTVFESTPGISSADLSWKDRRGTVRAASAAIAPTSVHESQPVARKTDASWRKRRETALQQRQVVFESTPAVSTAATSWRDRRVTVRRSPVSSLNTVFEQETSSGTAAPAAAPAPAPAPAAPAEEKTSAPEASAKGGYAAAADTPVASAPEPVPKVKFAEPEPATAPTAAATAAVPAKADAAPAEEADAEPLPQDLRVKVWADRLRVDTANVTKASDSSSSFGNVIPLLGRLLDGSGGGNPAVNSKLAEAFAEKHLSWLASGDAASESFFVALAHVLRYHSPWTAAAVEDTLSEVGLDLPSALDTICGGPLGLVTLLLTPQGDDTEEAEALLLLCDLTVVEETHRMLIIFVVVVLMMEAPAAEDEDFETLHARLQSEVLSGVGLRGATGICNLAEAACALQEATPLSLSSALALGNLASSQLDLPMCAVDPAEVLHHIYEKPPGNWRLMIVDVRRKPDNQAFPVTLRFKASQDRIGALESLPFDESIHLCLLADDAPAQGDEAFDLALHLATSTMRRHVSVVDGGWPAVIELARTLKLELTQCEAEEQPSANKKDDSMLPTVFGSGFKKVIARGSQIAASAQDMAKQMAGDVIKNF